MNRKSFFGGFLVGLVITLVAAIAGVFLFFGKSAVELKYFRDELMLSGWDEEGIPVNLLLHLRSMETLDGVFATMYQLDFYYQGEHRVYRDDFFAQTYEIDPENEFFVSFENELFDDLSTRETYAFEFEHDGKVFSVNVDGLNGDFITKNTLEYTRYMSVGDAVLEVEGESIELEASLEKIYSSDLDKYVFFDGFDDLEVNVNQFTFWDVEGNFYVVDKSDVRSEQEYYTSHAWVLHKDSEGNMRKFFDVDLEFVPGDHISTWELYIPGLDTQITLGTDQLLNKKRNTGITFGSVVSGSAPEPINTHGFFTHRWDVN